MEMIVLSGIFLVYFITKRVIDNRHEIKVLEAEKQSQLALDGQRYEKIREILTDGVVDGQPAALEALKPLVEVMASQMQSKEMLELKRLEFKHQLALAEAPNQPFKDWMEEFSELRTNLVENEIDIEQFQSIVQTMTTSTEKVFGVSLQVTLPVTEEKKVLPESTNGK